MRINPSPALLYECGIAENKNLQISDTGALIAYSGKKMGRSPKNKRIVMDENTKNIWWGPVNQPISTKLFNHYRDWAKSYLNKHPHAYQMDCLAGWDYDYQIKVRTLCTNAYHALFMHNMLIPNKNAYTSDFTIYNVGEVPLTVPTKQLQDKINELDDLDLDFLGTYSRHLPRPDPNLTDTLVAIDFTQMEMIIFGTEYAGEMKKGILTLFMYLMPLKKSLCLHSSANVDPVNDNSCLFFGLSGTGKTTISTDPHRKLIGDDEHVWTDKGIFNIEGGCYAKCIGLNPEKEPEIYQAIKFEAVLENVEIDPETHRVDFDSAKYTQNTRVSYPLKHIPNTQLPALGKHPKHIILLVCDAFGVLPPVAKLTPEQAVYFFINGYTTKIPGTEVGLTKPQMVFSACFGEPFLVWHPKKYGQMLQEKLTKYGSEVWLVNTGWIGGSYGSETGNRIPLKYTRRLVEAIHLDEFNKFKEGQGFWKFPYFEIEVPSQCNGVPKEALNPKALWSDPNAYDQTLHELWEKFEENNRKYIHFQLD